jgi:hypothetical protein
MFHLGLVGIRLIGDSSSQAESMRQPENIALADSFSLLAADAMAKYFWPNLTAEKNWSHNKGLDCTWIKGLVTHTMRGLKLAKKELARSRKETSKSNGMTVDAHGADKGENENGYSSIDDVGQDNESSNPEGAHFTMDFVDINGVGNDGSVRHMDIDDDNIADDDAIHVEILNDDKDQSESTIEKKCQSSNPNGVEFTMARHNDDDENDDDDDGFSLVRDADEDEVHVDDNSRHNNVKDRCEYSRFSMDYGSKKDHEIKILKAEIVLLQQQLQQKECGGEGNNNNVNVTDTHIIHLHDRAGLASAETVVQRKPNVDKRKSTGTSSPMKKHAAQGYCNPRYYRCVPCLICDCNSQHWIHRRVTPPLIQGSDDIDQSTYWDDEILKAIPQSVKRIRKHYREAHPEIDKKNWPPWLRHRNKRRNINIRDNTLYQRVRRAQLKQEHEGRAC